MFCTDKNLTPDYKDAMLLRRFISDRVKILPRTQTGVCAKHQRALSVAIKRARLLALLPTTPEQLLTMGLAEEPRAPARAERAVRAVAPAATEPSEAAESPAAAEPSEAAESPAAATEGPQVSGDAAPGQQTSDTTEA